MDEKDLQTVDWGELRGLITQRVSVTPQWVGHMLDRGDDPERTNLRDVCGYLQFSREGKVEFRDQVVDIIIEAYREVAGTVEGITVPNIYSDLLAIFEDGKGSLNMSNWHGGYGAYFCDTTHCLAGWAVTLAKDGLNLEDMLSTYIAGAVVYKVSTGDIPDFFAENDEAMDDLIARSCQDN